MLDDTKKKLLKLLVTLAWADGRVEEAEMEVVEAMLDAFGADQAGGDEIRAWAKVPRSLDDLDTSGLTQDDLELVLYQAVLLTFIDGEQTAEEVALLDDFISRLGLDKQRADAVLGRATARAKDMVSVLES